MKSWMQLLAGVVVLFWVLGALRADDQTTVLPSVPMTRDLLIDAVLAKSERVPLLLVFTQDHCDYCAKLDREVLNPNYASGAFNGKVIVRRFMINSYATVIDFDGKRVEASAFTSKHKVYATPTLLLVDARGNELTERIVGISSIDFFAAYLDESIAAARAQLPEK